MLASLIETLVGPLGGLVAGLGALLAAWLLGRSKGASSAREKRAAKDAEAYRNETKRQAEIDVGHGATDSERVKRLRDIANGGR